MINRIYVIIAILVVVVGVFIYFSERDVVVTNYPGSGTSIIALGDSLTAGVGATEGKDYVSRLNDKLGVLIINAGKSGDTTETALLRLYDDVLIKKPKLVIVMLGGNDYLRKIPKEITFENLDTIIKRIHSSGSMVLLVGVQGGIIGDPYKREFEALAEKHNTGYVSNILENIVGHNDRMSDGIHPNDLGYDKIAVRLEPAVKKLLK
ncbi:MAG TPA: GDSL-type esterase/lipase family protein [Candidatus Paceibacterota bacterium]